jgi:hypothetical protein
MICVVVIEIKLGTILSKTASRGVCNTRPINVIMDGVRAQRIGIKHLCVTSGPDAVSHSVSAGSGSSESVVVNPDRIEWI